MSGKLGDCSKIQSIDDLHELLNKGESTREQYHKDLESRSKEL